MEDIDGGLHPAVDGQSLDEMRWDEISYTNLCERLHSFMGFSAAELSSLCGAHLPQLITTAVGVCVADYSQRCEAREHPHHAGRHSQTVRLRLCQDTQWVVALCCVTLREYSVSCHCLVWLLQGSLSVVIVLCVSVVIVSCNFSRKFCQLSLWHVTFPGYSVTCHCHLSLCYVAFPGYSVSCHCITRLFQDTLSVVIALCGFSRILC